MSDRWVLVDDMDPAMSYVGPWFTDTGSLDGLGDNGPPYLSTLHGVNSPGSLTYNFNGSRVLVMGTVQFLAANGPMNPSFQCIVDDSVVDPSTNTSVIPNNRVLLCEKDGLEDTPHTITIKADVSDNHTFWIDSIEYFPLSSVPLDTASVSIRPIDPQVLMGGWSMMDAGYITQAPDSTFSFDFYGVSLTWYGFYNNTLPMEPTTGTYVIDEQDPVSFDLEGKMAMGTTILNNQIIFQTAQLAAADHRLHVTYGGDSTKTPLSLSLLVVQNGTNLSTTASTSNSTSGLSSISTAALPSRTSNSTSTSITITNSSLLSSIPSTSTAAATLSTSSSDGNHGSFRNGSSTSFIQPSDADISTSASTLTSSTPAAPTNTNADASGTWSRNVRSIMIGGTGALVVVFISLFIFLCLRRRGRRSPREDEKGHVVEPYTYSSLSNSPYSRVRGDSTSNLLQPTSKISTSHRQSQGQINSPNIGLFGSLSRSRPLYLVLHNPSSTSTNQPRDNDSGVRFPHSADSSMALLPPGYTPS